MADIEAEGARVLPLDVTDDESMRSAVETLLLDEGRIDALVNSAGYGTYGALEEVEMDEARRQFEVNVFGLVRMIQLVLPTMREQGSGTVVNISSMGGRIWMPIGGWYHATKHALEVLSDTLRLEVRSFGIHVVVIQPGAIESEWSEVAAEILEGQSRSTRYSELSESMGALLRDYDDAASPEVVAGVVSKALRTSRPRRRYTIPSQAKALVLLRWILPDWAWDRMVLAIFKGARS